MSEGLVEDSDLERRLLDFADELESQARSGESGLEDEDLPFRLLTLASDLYEMYSTVPNVIFLGKSIDILRECVALTEPSTPGLNPRVLCLMAVLLERSRLALPDLEDIDEAIGLALSLSPDQLELDSGSHVRSSLGNALATRFEITGDHDDIHMSVSALLEAAMTKDDNEKTEKVLSWLVCSAVLCLRANLDQDDCRENCKAVRKKVLELGPSLGATRSMLRDLSSALRIRCTKEAGDADLSLFIDTAREVISLDREQDEDSAGDYEDAALGLSYRYASTGETSDYIEGLEYAREWIRCSEDPKALLCAAVFLSARAMSGTLVQPAKVMAEAIAVSKRAIPLISRDSDDNLIRHAVQKLCSEYTEMAEITSSLSDVETGLREVERFLRDESYPNDSKLTAIDTKTQLLGMKYQWSYEPCTLDAWVESAQEGLRLCEETTPFHDDLQHNLAVSLHLRFLERGNSEDATNAIALVQRTVDKFSPGDPDCIISLATLASMYVDKARISGDVSGLNTAVKMMEEALQRCSSNSQRLWPLLTLAQALYNREGMTGNLDDLFRVDMIVGKQENCEVPRFCSERDQKVNLLQYWAMARARLASSGFNTQGPDSVVLALQQALKDGVPPASEIECLNSLAYINQTSSEHGEAIARLEEAEKKLKAFPWVNPERMARQKAWRAGAHLARYKDGAPQELADAESALKIATEALEICANSKGMRQDSENLAVNIAARASYALYNRTGVPEYLSTAIDAMEKYVSDEMSCPVPRMSFAIEAAKFYGRSGRWQRADMLLTKAADIQSLLSLRVLNRRYQLALAAKYSEVAELACVAALEVGRSPAQALEALERSRGTVISSIVDIREDVEMLRSIDPELHAEFLSVQQALREDDWALDWLGNIRETLGHKDRFTNAKAENIEHLRRLRERIRGNPKLRDFQKPFSAAQTGELAREGPVVVFNVTEFRSDAFILMPDGVHLVELAGLQPKVLAQKMRDLSGLLDNVDGQNVWATDHRVQGTLKWLWKLVVKPVLLKHLKLQLPGPGNRLLPRIWWVTTGSMIMAPLHAAGHHQQRSVANTMSYVVSSYTPSLHSLQYARRRDRFLCCQQGVPMMLTVGVRSVPERPDLNLPHVELDLESVAASVPSYIHQHQELEPSAEKVIGELSRCNIAHFSCHGNVDTSDPLSSSLVLGRDTSSDLHLNQIFDCKLGQAQLATLSACSTAQAPQPQLSHESMHLASSFQLAGFPHVIGSLWKISDRVSATFDAKFYRILFSHITQDQLAAGVPHEVVARACHEAVVELKNSADDFERLSLIWGPYIHVGP